MAPGKVYGSSKLQKVVSKNKFIFVNFENPRKQNCKLLFQRMLYVNAHLNKINFEAMNVVMHECKMYT